MQVFFITIMHSSYILYHSIHVKIYFGVHVYKSTEEHSKT